MSSTDSNVLVTEEEGRGEGGEIEWVFLGIVRETGAIEADLEQVHFA